MKYDEKLKKNEEKKKRSKYWYSNNDVFHVCANGTFWSNIFNWLNVSSILNPASWLTGNPIQFEQIYWKVEPMFWNNFVQSTQHTVEMILQTLNIWRKEKFMQRKSEPHLRSKKKVITTYFFFKWKLFCSLLV